MGSFQSNSKVVFEWKNLRGSFGKPWAPHDPFRSFVNMRLPDLKTGQASVGFMGLHWNLQLLLHASSHLAEAVGHEVFSKVATRPQRNTNLLGPSLQSSPREPRMWVKAGVVAAFSSTSSTRQAQRSDSCKMLQDSILLDSIGFYWNGRFGCHKFLSRHHGSIVPCNIPSSPPSWKLLRHHIKPRQAMANMCMSPLAKRVEWQSR